VERPHGHPHATVCGTEQRVALCSTEADGTRRWLLALGRETARQSMRFPLIGGLYQLMGAVFQLCNRVQVFADIDIAAAAHFKASCEGDCAQPCRGLTDDAGRLRRCSWTSCAASNAKGAWCASVDLRWTQPPPNVRSDDIDIFGGEADVARDVVKLEAPSVEGLGERIAHTLFKHFVRVHTEFSKLESKENRLCVLRPRRERETCVTLLLRRACFEEFHDYTAHVAVSMRQLRDEVLVSAVLMV
jgi:hypothetical protein